MTPALATVVLAAGRGTRMRNDLAKVMHPLAGQPLIAHVLQLAATLGDRQPIVVLAPGMPEVEAAVQRMAPEARVAIQDRPLGTGHALQAAAAHLGRAATVLVLYGDTPLLAEGTARALVDALVAAEAAVAVLGIRPPDPSGYGRLRVEAGGLQAIVEERHADVSLRRDGACNAGLMAFDGARVRELLAALPLRDAKQEYYLTDAVELARARGWPCVAVEGPWADGVGVNSQAQLAAAEGLYQERRRAALMEAGVIMPAPATVHLAFDTLIEPGASIEPYVVFGPGVRVRRGAVVHAFSHLEGAEVGPGASVGPYSRLRPGTRVDAGGRVGNFVELKNAQLGHGAKVNHLSYLGDADVGAGANIGAGTITCNYDGVAKHRTEIGDAAFIGSNSALVAPVKVGAGAVVGAGSVITADVPAGALAIARSAQTVREGRAVVLREALLRRERERRS